MSQIRKGFIAANAIDGSKLKLLNNEAIRAAQSDGADVELMKLDGSNVLQFLKMPQVSSDPSQGNDVARKSYVDAQVSAASDSAAAALASEQAARESADSGLQSAIDTEKGRIDAILSAATADADSFAEIVNLINSVDTENDSAFGSYVLSNNAALAQESADRAAGDAGLASDIADEASARQSADTTLQANIDQEVSDRQSAVSSEASARQNADNALQATIDALDVNDLGSVNITSAADGDLWQFDLESGKWVNVAPLTAASTITTGGGSGNGGSSEPHEILYRENPNFESGVGVARSPDVEPYVRGFIINSGPGGGLTKLATDLRLYQGSTNGTVAFAVKESIYGPVIATSEALSLTALPGPGTPHQNFEFPFSSPPVLAPETDYFIEWSLVGSNLYVEFIRSGTGDLVLKGNYWRSTTGGGSEVDTLNANVAIYLETAGEGSGGDSSTPAVGIVKTNASGLVDDSFISSAIARSSDVTSYVDAEIQSRVANDNYLQEQIDALTSNSSGALYQEVSDRQAADSAEQAAREAADSAEQSAREAADTTLQSNIDSESSARQAADTTLQSNIDAEKARIDAILTAATADADSFAEIVNLINSVDTENDSAFAAYVLSNDAALAAEVSDRQAAVSAEQSAREAADSAETSAREAADASLQGEVDAVESALAQEVSDRTAAVSAEQSARETADQGLQDAIDALDSSNAAALAQEVSDRQAADSAEQAAREAADSAETAAREAADSAEQSAREAADSALQDAVDQEVSDRTAAMSAEQAAREAADSAETSAREAADSTLQGNIDSEAAAREAADNALDSRVDALEAVSHHKEKFTLTSTDISNGYVDLSMECIANSEMVFVGALYFHSTDHYSVSTVGGVSRLTWTGPVMVGGASELVAGDVVYVRYMK